MDTKVRCPKCDLALTVDRHATGKPARCPACSKVFKIPAPDDLLDDTISAWIEDDVHEEVTERDYKNMSKRVNAEYFKSLEDKQLSDEAEEEREDKRRAEIARKKAAGEDVDIDIDLDLDSPAKTTAEKQPDKTGDEKTSANDEVARPTVNLGEISSADDDAESNDEIRQIAQKQEFIPVAKPRSKYPQDILINKPIPHLIVSDTSPDGVELGFDSRWISHAGFRESLPVACAFSGERDRDRLKARPLVFADQTDGDVSRVYSTEAAFERPLVPGQSTADLMKIMGTIDYMPQPFNIIIPYYVNNEISSTSLRCRTEQRDNGITCFVHLPNGEFALDWLHNVNGICGPEYSHLVNDVKSMAYADAEVVSDECRDRLAAWVRFQPMERLLLYVKDTDILTRDEGLGGIVVTNRRLVFHKNRHHGEVGLDEEAEIIVNTDEAVTNVFLEVYGQRTRVGKIRTAQSPELLDALKSAPKFQIIEG